MDEEMCEEAFNLLRAAVADIPVDIVAVVAGSLVLDSLEAMLSLDMASGDTEGIELANHIESELQNLMASYGYQVNIGSIQ